MVPDMQQSLTPEEYQVKSLDYIMWQAGRVRMLLSPGLSIQVRCSFYYITQPPAGLLSSNTSSSFSQTTGSSLFGDCQLFKVSGFPYMPHETGWVKDGVESLVYSIT